MNNIALRLGIIGISILWCVYNTYAHDVELDDRYSFTAHLMDPQEFKTNGYYGSGYLLPSIQPVATIKDISRTVPQWIDTEIVLENLFTDFETLFNYHLMSRNAYMGETSTNGMRTIKQLGDKQMPWENISLSEKWEGIIKIDKNLEEWKYLINLEICLEWDGYIQMPNIVGFEPIPDEYLVNITTAE